MSVIGIGNYQLATLINDSRSHLLSVRSGVDFSTHASLGPFRSARQAWCRLFPGGSIYHRDVGDIKLGTKLG